MSKRGEHFVELKVSIPTHMSGEEKKLMEKLKDIQVEKLRKQQTTKGSANFMGRMKETFAGI